MDLKQNETIEDLQLNGMRIIQSDLSESEGFPIDQLRLFLQDFGIIHFINPIDIHGTAATTIKPISSASM